MRRSSLSRPPPPWLRSSRTRESPQPPGTSLGADPLGAEVRERGVTDLEAAVKVARLAAPLGIRGVTVDATSVHDAGASDAQELAYSLLAGATYLRTLTAAGFSVDEAAGLIDFRYAATDEQFPTIAKLRAARRLWNRVAELQRRHLGRCRSAAARRDVAADDGQVRPLRQHAPHDCRRVRGRCRWGRGRHGAAFRRAARPA
ncbi:methylmalonyl-CoA mutase family protein [Aeromicrobium sp. UC242_57]|uniref:methylmalonyl-CoA mutase family protein n=1 Tax=Aeromicrobium sp. UC242_57 TaxID=3374624 RepID=UPI0037AB6258